MNEPYAPRPVAAWYMPAALASLLFMLLGCAIFLISLAIDPATLPLDQRAVLSVQPGWVVAANGAAVASGALGALLLVLRRRPAEPLLMVSLLSAAVWLGGLIAVPELRRALSENDVALALVIALVTWTIFWFARHSRQRGWLR